MPHLLADNCDRCHTPAVPARYVVANGKVAAQYRCRVCLWSWTCGWMPGSDELAAMVEDDDHPSRGRVTG